MGNKKKETKKNLATINRRNESRKMKDAKRYKKINRRR